MVISFAIIENNKVKNVIETEEEESIATQVLKMMFEDAIIVKINEEEKKSLFLDSEFIDNKFYSPRPHPSWIIKNENWHPPVSVPQDGKIYEWEESEQCWKENLNITVT